MVRPSTTTSARATQLVQSLVAVTSNRRVSVPATSRRMSSDLICTRVDSAGSCSPSSSFGWYAREMPASGPVFWTAW
jgi:hypothetical protein